MGTCNRLEVPIIIIIIIIKNEKIRVTLCENAAGALYIVNWMQSFAMYKRIHDYRRRGSWLY